ncbi:hypothetical protein JTB14_011036 [Gonioctena quinquepunctata]|nr:hypothetical protein JTB14_011036 [Gonioctena quinquepunctata]
MDYKVGEWLTIWASPFRHYNLYKKLKIYLRSSRTTTNMKFSTRNGSNFFMNTQKFATKCIMAWVLSKQRSLRTSLPSRWEYNTHENGMNTNQQDKHEFPAEMTLTKQDAQRVIATKGQKQVGRVKLITVCCFINAAGNTLPPAIIFPLKKFKDNYTNQKL